MRHSMRLLVAALMAVTLAAGTSAILAVPAQAKTWLAPKANPDADPGKDLNEYENRVLIQINKIRAKRDLKKVRVFESCVDGMSERWAQRIKKTGKFVHRDLDTVLDECDVMWTGETLVRGSGLTPREAVQLWMDSPPHKAVLMKKRARWAGVGVRVDGQGRFITVLNFADAS